MQKRPLKRDGQVRKVIVLDFLGVLSTITHMHYIKRHREARCGRNSEWTRGSISKRPVLTMFKYVPAALLNSEKFRPESPRGNMIPFFITVLRYTSFHRMRKKRYLELLM